MRIISIFVIFLFCNACSQNAVPDVQNLRIVPDGIRPYILIDERHILLDGVTVHIGDGTSPLALHSVLIVDDKIADIGPKGSIVYPPGTRILELDGATVMPGIIGMHNHLHMPGITLMDYTAPRMYLAGGVTTIQTTGSAEPEGELTLKSAIDTGHVPGPNIVPTAPYITGPDGNAVMDKPDTPEAARAFVNRWADAGMQWIKLYRHTDPEIAKTVIDEAHKRGLKVTGHLCSITFAEAAAMGIDSIEHGLNAATDFVADKPPGKCVSSRSSKLVLNVDDPVVASLIDTLVANEVTITSTLAILESGFPHRPQGDARALDAMSPALRTRYDSRQNQLKARLGNTTSTPAYWELITQFERRFVERGGHLVTGPDTGRHVFPGFGDQRNFELLVEAGFGIPQTVQIMTHNGAKALGLGESIGRIQPGYQADLIVIDGDLASDVSMIRSVKYVFKGGLGYDPAALIADVKGQVGTR